MTMPSSPDPAAAWIERHRDRLEILSDLLLGLAVVLLWTRENEEVSAAVGTVWLLLRLGLGGHGLHGWVLVLLILLNLRGVVLQEGPKPVGPIDYLVILSAFVAGLQRQLAHWRRTVIFLCGANLIGLLLRLNPLQRSLLAIFGGRADERGWEGQTWAGQYFRAADMMVNQSALLCGLGFCLALALLGTVRGRLRPLIGASALVTGIACFATGSRMAMLLPPLLAALGLLVCHEGTIPTLRRWRQAVLSPAGRRRLAPLLASLALVVLLVVVLQQTGVLDPLWDLYAGRKLEGDAMRRRVQLCYAILPFRWPWFWLIGAGYDQPRRRFCDEDVGIEVSHAHNIFSQVMGDSGLVAAVAIVITALLITVQLRRLLPQAIPSGPERALAAEIGPSLISGSLFLLIFHQFELGLMKVTLLEMLFGFLPACGFWRPAPPGSARALSAPPTPDTIGR